MNIKEEQQIFLEDSQLKQKVEKLKFTGSRQEEKPSVNTFSFKGKSCVENKRDFRNTSRKMRQIIILELSNIVCDKCSGSKFDGNGSERTRLLLLIIIVFLFFLSILADKINICHYYFCVYEIIRFPVHNHSFNYNK